MNLSYSGFHENECKSISEPFRRSRKNCVLCTQLMAHASVLLAWETPLTSWYTTLLLSLLNWNKFLHRYSLETAPPSWRVNGFICLGIFFCCFSLFTSIQSHKWQHGLTSHFHSCYPASTTSSWSSPVQLDRVFISSYFEKYRHGLSVCITPLGDN